MEELVEFHIGKARCCVDKAKAKNGVVFVPYGFLNRHRANRGGLKCYHEGHELTACFFESDYLDPKHKSSLKNVAKIATGFELN
jgi:hypothetical protein